MLFFNKLIDNSKLSIELDLDTLVNKKDVISKFGHGFNDYYSSVWMYRIGSGNKFWDINYLYGFFENDKVKTFKFSRFRNKPVYSNLSATNL